MSPTVTTKNSKHKEVIWQQYRLSLAVTRCQILGGKHVLILGPEAGKIWWLKKVQFLQEKYHCRWTLLRKILATQYNHLSSYQSLVSMWFLRNGKSEQFLETVYPRQQWFQFERHNIGNMRWSVTSWILPIWAYERKQHLPRIGSRTDLEGWIFGTLHWPPCVEQFTENLDCRCSVRH